MQGMNINPVAAGNQLVDTAELARRAARAEAQDKQELREVCEDFEAIFIKIMLDSMRDTLSDNTLIPKNAGEKLFEDQLYDEYAKKMSRTANLGIADMMYQQLSGATQASRLDITG